MKKSLSIIVPVFTTITMLWGCNRIIDPANINVLPTSVSSVIITDQPPDSIQLDRFELDRVKIAGDIISVKISHSGGCKNHAFSLYMSPAAFLESIPVQANLFLRHNNNGDACEALIDTTVSFNLQPVAVLFQQHYGGKDEIIINVFNYFEIQPGEKLSVSYLPE